MNINNEINLALKEFSIGKKEIAYKKLKKIFKKNKEDDKLRFNIAVIEESLNLIEEAKKNYEILIKSNNNYKAMINLYLLNIKEGNFINALEIINKVINLNIEIDIVIKDKAFVLYKLNKYNESITICEDYLKIRDDSNILNILGLNYFKKNELEKSEDIFKRGLKIQKDNSFLLNSLGRLYHEKRDSQNAEKYLLRAYKLNNKSYEIINNLAGFYREEGKYKYSIYLYKEALKINPRNTTVINNLGKAYFDINELEKAEQYCLKALNLDKHNGNVQKILSLIYLRQQKYKVGWGYFDGRLNLSDFVEKNLSINNIRKKLLYKKKLNKNSKILVLREQGVGDEILYGTMYGDLLNKYEDVTIECDKRLINIFSNSFPDYKKSFVELGSISSSESKLKDYDVAIYAGSLGKFFRNKIDDFTSGCYLSAENKLISKFQTRLKGFNKKINIGISWKSFKNRYANEKSLSLKDFSNIFLVKNCNFINLQYGDVKSEIHNFNQEIITFEDLDLFNDLDNLASLLKNLDLFISVSNSTAHLAAALGVRTLLVRPENHAIFHYWNQGENYTPWYKAVTLLDRDKFKSQKDLLSQYLN